MSGNYHLFFNGNYNNDHIEYCLEQCIKLNDIPGIELGKVLLRMSKTQRKKLTHSGGY